MDSGFRLLDFCIMIKFDSWCFVIKNTTKPKLSVFWQRLRDVNVRPFPLISRGLSTQGKQIPKNFLWNWPRSLVLIKLLLRSQLFRKFSRTKRKFPKQFIMESMESDCVWPWGDMSSWGSQKFPTVLRPIMLTRFNIQLTVIFDHYNIYF